MNYQLAYPSKVLAPFVKQYWGLDSHRIEDGMGAAHRVIPTGLMEMIFYIGDRPRLVKQNESISSSSFISGHQNTFYDIEVDGNCRIFSVSFLPHGAFRFFKFPMSDLSNQNVPLRFILKQDASDLESKLSESISFSEQIKIIEQYLMKLLRKQSDNFEFNKIAETIKAVNITTDIDVGYLNSLIFLSRRQFERVFSKCVGPTPKQFLKVVRFQRAIHLKYQYTDASLTEISYAAGYYDQSHMINDFKQLSGRTPSELFSPNTLISDYFSI